MDRILARRLESDEDFSEQVVKLAKDYLTLAQNSLNYWADEFDAAHDILMCYAPLTKDDLDRLEKGHPKRFVLPMTATQINTMTTFIAQALFGEATPHKVDGRGPEDEIAAEHVNQLLRWNAEQQPTYLLGYLWIQDVLTFNRGVFYNSWAPIFETAVEVIDVEDAEELDEAGQPVVFQRANRVRKEIGGYSRLELVSPYDFYSDPSVPLWRLQEGRFCGHRTCIPWQELKRRSKLPVDHPAYVLPSAVELLKQKRKKKGRGNPVPITKGSVPSKSASMSRTAYERARSTDTRTGQETANAEDPGIVDCQEMWIRLVPEDHDLWEGEEPVIIQILVGNQEVVLALNQSTYKHDMYPYSVAEGRPNGYQQFSPSYVILLKSLQDYVDYLKNRHQEAISRTLGNIFIAKTDKVNIQDFLNPDKEGLIIPVLPEASSEKLDDIIRQVQVNDVTKNFTNEMMEFVNLSETVSGANANMQGQVDGRGTATEFAGTQQMQAGRMSAIARLISVQGLMPQTMQIVANFQQFLAGSMAIRFVGTPETSPRFQGISALTITPDIIQGKFDFIAHDGTLPGTDSRKVAALARILEAAQGFPQFFQPGAGNLDARKILFALLKSAGVNVENFQFDSAVLQQLASAQAPPPMAPSLPDLAAMLAVGGTGPLPLQPGPGRPAIPDPLNLPSAAPPQVRPQNI